MGVFSPKLLVFLSIFTTNLPYSSNYKDYVLEASNQNKLCSASFPHREVEIKENEAIRVNFSLTEEEQSSNSKYNKQTFICVFFLKVPENMGIFGVIQKMSFRRDSRTSNCTDFIQFRSKPRMWVEKMLNVDLERKTEMWGVDQICGDVNPLQEPFSDVPPLPHNVARHATLNRGNHLEVKISISKKKLKPEEKIEIVVAFTPFRVCQNDSEELKRCGPDSCILKTFFNDRVVNCPFVNCVDEDCSPYIEAEQASPWSGKVAVTAVSSIFLSFFLFLGCIMMCRYAEMFCWGDGHPPDRGTELSQVEPTAPPTDGSSPDKDLPPAYETLFPERLYSFPNSPGM